MHHGDRAERRRAAEIGQARKRLEAEAERIASGQDSRTGPHLDRRTFLLGSLASGAAWTRWRAGWP